MLKGKDLLSIQDLSRRDISDIFQKTRVLKRSPFRTWLKGKNIVMLFSKPSTRTRVSFEVGINQLGGDDIFLQMNDIQMSRGESWEDTSRVLARYGDGIVARLFKHDNLITLARSSSVPVINGLTDLLHPCQALSDVFTIIEKKKQLKGLKLVFMGDGNNNVTHSLMHACSKLGMNMTVSCPKGYDPQKKIISHFYANRKSSGSKFSIERNPKKAAKNADVLYTDTWVSMGNEREARVREKAFKGYQLNSGLVKLAKKDCLVMHDLPAHRGKEITSEVMDGKNSVIFDQAENRMHVEKAILALIYGH